MAIPFKKCLIVGVTLLCVAPIQSFADEASRNQEITERFTAADKNHDGKLTLAEAKAGMPRVAEHFNIIDADNKGYVTLAQIEAMAAR